MAKHDAMVESPATARAGHSSSRGNNTRGHIRRGEHQRRRESLGMSEMREPQPPPAPYSPLAPVISIEPASSTGVTRPLRASRLRFLSGPPSRAAECAGGEGLGASGPRRGHKHTVAAALKSIASVPRPFRDVIPPQSSCALGVFVAGFPCAVILAD